MNNNPYKYNCPHCNETLSFDSDMHSKHVLCSNCNKEFICGNIDEKKNLTKDLSSSSLEHHNRILSIRTQDTFSSERKVKEGISSLQSTVSTSDRLDKVEIQLPFEIGDFILQVKLASGGMSDTYLAIEKGGSRNVAIKIPNIADNDVFAAFKSECEILSSLDHINIVRMLSQGEVDINSSKFPYLIMDFIDGQNLKQYIISKGKLTWEEAFPVLINISEALCYLKEEGVCHRDIKPSNIIFNKKTQQWVLIDFGVSSTTPDNISLSLDRKAKEGTIDYMAPEQFIGKSDARSDIWALGIVIWESLIGTLPRAGTKYPFQSGIKDIPLEVDSLIEKMTEHRPAERYESPADLLNAIKLGVINIKDSKERHNTYRKIKKVFFCSFLSILIMIGAWFLLNFIAIAKAKEIYEKNKLSPTIALRELKNFDSNLPLYIGASYIDSELIELEKKSQREYQTMENEFSNIKNSIISTNNESQTEIEDKIKLTKAFLAKWDTIFKNDKILNEVHSNLALLDSRGVFLEEKEKIDAIAPVNSIYNLNNAYSEFEKIQKLQLIIKSSTNKKDIEKLEKDFKDKIIALSETQINLLIKKQNYLLELKDINEAERIFSALKKTFGDFDDKIKPLGEDIQSAKFEQIKYNASTLCEKFWRDKNYLGALNALKELREKHGADSRINNFVEEYKKKTEYNYAENILKIKDLSEYIKEVKNYREVCSDNSENINILRENITRLFATTLIDKANNYATSHDISQLSYEGCLESDSKYLSDLKSSVLTYIYEGTVFTKRAAQYLYERNPRWNIEKTIYKVKISSVNISLSNYTYDKIKNGLFSSDADIRFIFKPGYEYSYIEESYINVQNKYIYPPSDSFFYAEVNASDIKIRFEDKDVGGYSRDWNIKQSIFKTSGSRKFSITEDSSLITITWTTY